MGASPAAAFRNLEELARLADELFDRRVRPSLRPEDDGKFAAVDLNTEEFELDADDYAAVSRLRARLPAADAWLLRVGEPTTYRMGRA